MSPTRKQMLVVLAALTVAASGGALVTALQPLDDVSAPPTWTERDVPTDRDLHTVAFVSDTEGWVGADDGVLYHTTDAGRTWEAVHAGLFNAVEMMSWIDEDRGWAATSDFSLVQTTDGGQTWEQLNAGGRLGSLEELEFVDEQTGFASGQNGIFKGYLARTDDGGETWNATNLSFPDTESYFYEVAWSDDLQRGLVAGWVFGVGDGVARTEDGGDTWEFVEVDVPPLIRLTDLAMVSDEVGVLTGWRGTMFRTVDGGASWEQVATPTAAHLWDVAFVDEKRGWAVGSEGAVLATVDAGRTWFTEPSGESGELSGLFALEDGQAWAAGSAGTLTHRKGNDTAKDMVDDAIEDVPREPHAPILIVGDDGFQRPLTGLRSGSGTAEDPYVISGWNIVPAATDGITLVNTTAHVEIRDNRIHDAARDEAAIRLVDAANVHIEANELEATGDGISASGGGPLMVQGNQLLHNENGVRASNVEDLHIAGNEVAFSGTYGVQLDGLQGPRVSGNSFKANAEAALRLDALPQPVRGAEIVSNSFQDDGAGVRAQGTIGLLLEANTFLLAETVGAHIDGGEDGIVRDNVLAGNTEAELRVEEAAFTLVEANTVDVRSTGIHLLDDESSTVRANLLTDGEATGIRVDGSSQALVQDNRVVRGNMPIRVTGGTTSSTLHENHVSGGFWGIWIQGGSQDNLVEANRIHAESTGDDVLSPNEGVSILGESHSNTVRGNLIEGTSSAVSVSGKSQGTMVVENQAFNVTSSAYVAAYFSTGTTFLQNSVEGVGSHGLVFDGRSDGSTAIANRIVDADQRGISLASISDITLRENTIEGALDGLVARDDCPWAASTCDTFNVTIANNTFTDLARDGIRLEEGTSAAVRDVRVADTVLQGQQRGSALVLDGARQIQANANNLASFSVGLNASDAGPVDATENWWNASDGPGGEGPGSGLAIVSDATSSIAFDPWLAEPNPSAGAGG